MTRRLPWDRNALERTATQKKQTATTPRRTATPNRAVSRATTAATSPLDHSNHKPARSNGFLEGRSPSTSPPPEPLTETFMIDGLESDDKYRMVEDELVTIAGHFTAHLHAAEYQRLKAQTRTQNAETIKTISRPVVGSLTELARKRQEELLRKKKQREALRRAKRDAGRDDEDTGDETSVPWRGTSLQGLMHSPKKKEVPLMALTRTDSGVRTSASGLFGGVVRSSQSKMPAAPAKRSTPVDETTTEDESDDLGGPVKAPVRRETEHSRPSRSAYPAKTTAKVQGRPSNQQRTTHTSTARLPDAKASSNEGTAAPNPISSARVATNTPPTNDEDDDDDDDDVFTRFKNRRANSRPQRRAPVKKEKPDSKETGDIIPSFI
ncbi:hypothetical protein CABS01_04804 [Colletotrichum abscissum]|uniref:Uncharacterized protein n=1 Tax=Colletotrichum abscissum TaxID=1671311 RepID=A0A9Q0B5F8_9PEZI|nr:uncharacterized protein CABS01_04804 [Colletotrichum abscissum]KAI3553924.1 hypothetical protein CABS02_05962 [Colletotrichum abscissum]KAK1472161.1 hypothetical protein CABS01_04804 [Colletotrichum abscissum]